MLVDLVLDTNVIQHADDPRQDRQDDARSLLLMLVDSEVVICVDKGFSWVESENRSVIGSEYHQHLCFGMLGFEVIGHLARTQRIRLLDTKISEGLARLLRKEVGKPHDRVFVRVAINSVERVLASHDYADFSDRARERIARVADAEICDARGAIRKIEAP